MFDPSLIDLLAFAPSERVVKEYIEDTKSSWAKGNYWLGGQIKLSPTDKITDEMLKKVQAIYDGPCDACNSAEMASIWRSKRQFSEIQIVVHQFRNNAKNRLLTDLNKTKLNEDVNNIIVSMCG
jgi:hypothetical protein